MRLEHHPLCKHAAHHLSTLSRRARRRFQRDIVPFAVDPVWKPFDFSCRHRRCRQDDRADRLIDHDHCAVGQVAHAAAGRVTGAAFDRDDVELCAGQFRWILRRQPQTGQWGGQHGQQQPLHDILRWVQAPYFIVTFCTLKFPISPTYSVLSLRQSIALTVPNSFGSLPALPNLPIIVPSRRIL